VLDTECRELLQRFFHERRQAIRDAPPPASGDGQV
jgi:hypothetical protein